MNRFTPAALVIAIAAIASSSAVHGQRTMRTFTYRASYRGQPVVLTYSRHRLFHGSYIGEGTLVALGRHYWVEDDFVTWGSGGTDFNRVYARPSGFNGPEMVAEFTLANTCNPDCADSATYSLKVTMQGPRPGLPLPNGIVLVRSIS